MPGHLINIEATPSSEPIRERMIRELESFLEATVDGPVSGRWIPTVQGAQRMARYDGREHVGPGEN